MQPITAHPLIQEICPYRSWQSIPARICEKPFSFYLDSAAVNFPGARYSYLGCDPFLVFKCSGHDITLEQNGLLEHLQEDPFALLKRLIHQFKIIAPSNAPAFIGGAMGYFGYDLGRVIERLPICACDDIAVPDCCLGFYSTVIIIDHLRERVFAAASGLLETQPALQHKKAQADIAALKSLLASSPAPDKSTGELKTQRIASALTADFDKKAYCKAIQEAQRYIAEGDIYQVNLSQRFKCSTSATPWDLYMRLRSASPAPFAGFFNAGDHQLLSSSPERFLRISGSTVETRPIKGTRPRGATTAEDQKLRQELLASAKDRAELIMIVDLERNDLGRVCRYGSIHPEELLRLEEHPVVHHLVSTIKGELAEGHDHIDCLRACFPGGSITGAPKIRAMEIIEELEPCRRKMYTGSMGYLGFNNETDLNILIRTMLHVNGTYYFNVGGGIVADSDPEMEYEETLHKGKGIMQALGIAENR